MKNILLPTDFSQNSWNAITYAIQLFQEDTCTFHLFNAYTPVVYDVSYVLISPAQYGLGDVIRNTAQKNLNDLKNKIKATFGENPKHSFETLARFETLVMGIKELIDERQIDLVIMGTKGATGAKEVLFGSNTVQVFSDIHAPVMAIPSHYDYQPLRHILFPSDLEVEFIKSKVQILKDIAISHEAQLHVMHVSTGYDLTEEKQQNKAALKVLFNDAFVFHDYENMDIADAINKFQDANPIQLLAMVNNKRSFFENLFFKNTINQIGFHLKIPFLVMPSR